MLRGYMKTHLKMCSDAQIFIFTRLLCQSSGAGCLMTR